MSDIVPPKAPAEAPPEHASTAAVEDDSDPDIDELDGWPKPPLRLDLTDNIQTSSISSRRTRLQNRRKHKLSRHSPSHKLLAPEDPPSPKHRMGNSHPNLKMNLWLG
jgi:hypothetical protein